MANIEKRLCYHKVVGGILALCLMLMVGTHLDAQPQPRGYGQAGAQQIDSRRLNQILERIEKRLTSLEKQRVSHHPAAPAMHRPGPSHGQASLESRVTALEQKISQQPRVLRKMALRSGAAAAPAANQASSSPDLTTIEARVAALENQAGSPQSTAPAKVPDGTVECRVLRVVDSAGQSIFWVGETGQGSKLSLKGPDGSEIWMRAGTPISVVSVSPMGVGGLPAVILKAGLAQDVTSVLVRDASGTMQELGPKNHTH